MTGFAKPKRTVLMTVDAVGGVWRYAMDLAAGLAATGLKTVFLGLGPRPSRDKYEEAERYGRLLWLDEPLDWLADERAISDVPEKIAHIALEQKVDLLHLNLPTQAAGLKIDLPVLVVSHSCVPTWFQAVRKSAVPEDWLWHERLNRAGFARADMVVAPSYSHAMALQRCYGEIGGLTVVKNASRQPLAHADKTLFAMSAGRWWDEGKNGLVLDAAAALTEVPLVMVGDSQGPNGQRCYLQHAVDRGPRPHQDVIALMRDAAIFVSPSIYEPFGLAPLEAARCGAALVLSDIPTYRELWSNAAIFVDPHDPEGFAKSINALASNPDRRAELAKQAQERSRVFSLDAQADGMAHLYAVLCERTISTAAE
ncbi:glycosyltransferase family 4 protein [Oryzifoliimicrobium ureilyticus]|uniref:glycosyltransferase family 4 protein n=1 Tax=Oryzifoliimicrobium ureilyticus TaxID=3113724 RepID=UPI00307655D7